jgi:hypothetical protein
MGGGSSSFQKKEIVDPKPNAEQSGGISVATSSGCDSCVLTFDLGSTTSLVTATRVPERETSLGNRIQLTPSIPLTLTFNGRRASFAQLYLYYPAPLRVEGEQADAVLECVDPDNIILFVPLKSDRSGGDFLDTIAPRITPTADGLGIPDPTTKEYKKIPIPTGNGWSFTSVVTAADPYFTWSDSPLEQYVISDNPFQKHIGWRPKPGPQVIYFKNPVPVASSSIDLITATIGPVKPEDVLHSVTNTMFVTGEPCAAAVSDTEYKQPPPPKFKLSGLSEVMLYIFFSIAVFFGIIAAVALVVAKDSWAYKIGTNIASWFERK